MWSAESRRKSFGLNGRNQCKNERMKRMQDNLIDSLVAKIAQEVKGQAAAAASAPKPEKPSVTKQTQSAAEDGSKKIESVPANGRYTVADYPLMEKHRDIIKTPTGKPLADVTLDAVSDGRIDIEDVRISAEMLLNQADIAESAGKRQIAENLRRAAEMTVIEDDVVIKMYDMLRPNRATRQQLTEMAETLKNKYHAHRLAELVTEACEVYDKRGILLKD